MKKALTILAIVLGFVIFFVGISLLINSGQITYDAIDKKQFPYNSIYEFVRDETVQGIQTAGKLCAVFGGATALLCLFKSKKDQ